MTAEIITPSFNTRLDIPPERVLDAAKEAKLDDVLVIGRTNDGELYMACSTGDGPEILWLIENAKGYILNPDRD